MDDFDGPLQCEKESMLLRISVRLSDRSGSGFGCSIFCGFSAAPSESKSSEDGSTMSSNLRLVALLVA